VKFVSILPLPATWTPLVALQAYLQRKLAEYDANCPPGEEVYDWRRFVLLLWASGDLLDLGGNANSDDRTVDEIPYPLQDRHPDNFHSAMLDQGRLVHVGSGRIFHNLHLRDRRAEHHAEALTTAAARLAAKKSENARNAAFVDRCKLVYAVWERQGYPGDWSSETAFQSTILANPNRSVLQVDDRARRRCWRKVQTMKPR